ncbi:MAG: hypothetical protein ACTSYB_03450 [Candidatus Helarchaeota archaeon]
MKSDTPLEFEKIHAKPLNPKKQFAKGEYVYICGKKDGYFLVNDKIHQQDAEIILCPSCGAAIEANEGRFCEYCGAELSK